MWPNLLITKRIHWSFDRGKDLESVRPFPWGSKYEPSIPLIILIESSVFEKCFELTLKENSCGKSLVKSLVFHSWNNYIYFLRHISVALAE